MLQSRLSAENAALRNQLRNITAYVNNKIMPGAGRNTTSRDAKAFADSMDMYKAVNYDVVTGDLMAGLGTAGE